MTGKNKILIIDDDRSILELLKVNFEIKGYQVVLAEDAIKGIALNRQESPDLVILDIVLPKLDGLTACQQIRADQKGNSEVPILMLSVVSNIENKIAGFDAGTDDYLTKPFEISELLARSKALIKRASKLNNNIQDASIFSSSEILHSGDITLLPETREAEISKNTIKFTPIEFDILYCLMQNLGKTISPNQLLKEIWGYTSNNEDIETIRVHIRHLRQRLENLVQDQDGNNKKYIRTIYGKGYQLIPEGFKDD